MTNGRVCPPPTGERSHALAAGFEGHSRAGAGAPPSEAPSASAALQPCYKRENASCARPAARAEHACFTSLCCGGQTRPRRQALSFAPGARHLCIFRPDVATASGVEMQGRARWPEQQKPLPEATAAYAALVCRLPMTGEGVAVLCFGFILEWLIAFHTVCAPGCVETQNRLSLELAREV